MPWHRWQLQAPYCMGTPVACPVLEGLNVTAFSLPLSPPAGMWLWCTQNYGWFVGPVKCTTAYAHAHALADRLLGTTSGWVRFKQQGPRAGTPRRRCHSLCITVAVRLPGGVSNILPASH